MEQELYVIYTLESRQECYELKKITLYFATYTCMLHVPPSETWQPIQP